MRSCAHKLALRLCGSVSGLNSEYVQKSVAIITTQLTLSRVFRLLLFSLSSLIILTNKLFMLTFRFFFFLFFFLLCWVYGSKWGKNESICLHSTKSKHRHTHKRKKIRLQAQTNCRMKSCNAAQNKNAISLNQKQRCLNSLFWMSITRFLAPPNAAVPKIPKAEEKLGRILHSLHTQRESEALTNARSVWEGKSNGIISWVSRAWDVYLSTMFIFDCAQTRK